jgi:hypothetical protein
MEPNALDFEVPVDGTDKSIGIARADQGSRIVQLASSNPGLGINIWEGPEGDDLKGFVERWQAWVQSDEEVFPYVDSRFGMTAYLLRAGARPGESIPGWVACSLQYARREDTRAPVARAGMAFRDAATGLPLLRS